MSLPISPLLEIPILQELVAVGGKDDVRYIYKRLVSYFPSLSDAEISRIINSENEKWKKIIQKAGRSLADQKYISRDRGIWTITKSGRDKADAENPIFTTFNEPEIILDHKTIQNFLVKIGEILGYYSESEYEYYDVIWRDSMTSQRISYVFEVQSKGNIDSAFAKLKRAFDAQRTKPFLILASERDTNRANKSLENEFRELRNVITILGFAEIRKMHDNLVQIESILPKFLEA